MHVLAAGRIAAPDWPVWSLAIAATLTGRRASDEMSSKLGTYEAALALGMTSPEAAYEVIQPTAKEGSPQAWTTRVRSGL